MAGVRSTGTVKIYIDGEEISRDTEIHSIPITVFPEFLCFRAVLQSRAF